MNLRLAAMTLPFELAWDWANPLVQNVVWSLVAVAVVYGLTILVSTVFNRAIGDLRVRHKSRKYLYYTATALLLLVLLGVWSGNLGQLALAVTAIGAALAFALQQPVFSLAGWLYIVTRRPYDVGDRIELGGVSGDVIDIRLFKTVLLETYPEGRGHGTQSTGRVVDFPNSDVLSKSLLNYTRGFEYLWNEYPILITFESNWAKAKRLLQEIVDAETHLYEAPARTQIERMARSFLIQYDNLTPTVYLAIRDSGVELGLRYLTPARQRRTIRDRISAAILEAFEPEPDIELAYPTYRLFRRDVEEGKLARRADDSTA